eukprot:TRINITY_DN68318_c0_g1_i1.p1 TRINITY_DN68318_c0_g1~~TRINITY_DN68318_c0_g1_i1.p1  ORF type:complete len:590 (+),score=277.46 TRINITY_DN68318_c0_g1_i1:17-1786(+)
MTPNSAKIGPSQSPMYASSRRVVSPRAGDDDGDGPLDQEQNVTHMDELAKELEYDEEVSMAEPVSKSRGIVSQSLESIAHEEYLEGMETVTFSWWVFWRELLYHVFQPLAVPVVWLAEGWAGVLNRKFWGNNGGFWSGTINYVLTVVPLVLYDVSSEADRSRVSQVEIVSMCFMFLLRSAVIAIKYAYFPAVNMARRAKRVIPDDVNGRTMLIVGWSHPDLTQCLDELMLAIQRTKVNLLSMTMTFTRDKSMTREQQNHAIYSVFEREGFLDNAGVDEDCRTAAEQGHITASLLALRLVQAASDAAYKGGKFMFNKVIPVLTLAHVLVPILTRAAVGESPIGETWQEHVILLSIAVAQIPIFGSNLSFLWIAVLDYRRRSFVLQQLSALLSQQQHHLQCDRLRGLPTIDTRIRGASNLFVWQQIRKVTNNWGRQFFLRVQLFTSLYVACISLLAGIMCFSLITRHEVLAAGIAIVTFDLIVLGMSLFFTVNAGKRVNNQRAVHGGLLTRLIAHVVKVLSVDVVDGRDDKIADRLKNTRAMAESVQQYVAARDEEDPVTILGFRADNSFSRSILIIGAAGCSILIRSLVS